MGPIVALETAVTRSYVQAWNLVGLAQSRYARREIAGWSPPVSKAFTGLIATNGRRQLRFIMLAHLDHIFNCETLLRDHSSRKKRISLMKKKH